MSIVPEDPKLPCPHAASASASRDAPTGAAVFQGAPYTGDSNAPFSVFSPWENTQRDLRIPSQ
ncbi:MAG: hypothetical protein OXU61_06665 [Gammaproteobacteria bacterium]|nr:hypothetical protein [Gammaproteobacteria bacterium]